jgi:DNA-binding NarL/FixJ family response regulator
MASELYLSLNTIKTHTSAIYRKLGVRSRHAAIEEARRRQLI